MRKIVLKKSDLNKNRSRIIEEGRTVNFDLKYLKDSFNALHDWIEVEEDVFVEI